MLWLAGGRSYANAADSVERRNVMLEQYKKTAVGMQVTVCLAAGVVYVWSHLLSLAATFFVIMQVGAVLGAMWGARLRNKLERREGMLPLRRV